MLARAARESERMPSDVLRALAPGLLARVFIGFEGIDTQQFQKWLPMGRNTATCACVETAQRFGQ